MYLISRRTFIIYLFLSSLLISCNTEDKVYNKNKEEVLTKKERLNLFLESPLKVNTNTIEQSLSNVNFYKSYILIGNPHYNENQDSILKSYSNSYVLIEGTNLKEDLDSIIRISNNKDVIEILKNKYVEHIIYMRMNSKGIKLNYGIYLGMNLDSFSKLLPLKLNENYIASYIKDESFEVKFLFDKESKKLKEFNYLSIID